MANKEVSRQSKMFSQETIQNLISQFDGMATDSITTPEGVEVVEKRYSLVKKTENGLEEKKLTDLNLIHHTDRILALNALDSTTAKIRCYELAESAKYVANNGMTLVEYGRCFFGYSESTTRNYKRLGEIFFNENGGMKLDIPNISMRQAQALLKFVDKVGTDKLIEGFKADDNENLLFHPDDSTSQLSNAANKYLSGEVDIHGIGLLSEDEKKERRQARKAERDAKKVAVESGQDEKKDVRTPYEKVGDLFGEMLTTGIEIATIQRENNIENMESVLSAIENLKNAINEYIKANVK